MADNRKCSTVVIVDNVDVDNPAAALAACHPRLGLNVRAVIVTGRPAHPDPDAPIASLDWSYSREVLRRNSRRLKGLLRRMGQSVPVFEGLIPPKTLVEHRIHINEQLLDLHGDDRVTETDGSLAQALDFLSTLEGTIDCIIGGPLSEARRIMDEPRLRGHLGTLTCQLGLFGFGGVATMAGNGRTFNSAADPDATRAILAGWPNDVYMVPTDVTKSPKVGFDTPGDLRDFGVVDELVRLYEIFWKEALEPRGERIYPHDVHPVFLMAQLHESLRHRPYRWQEVSIETVGEHGEISATFGQTASCHPRRFVVKNVAARHFMDLFSAVLR